MAEHLEIAEGDKAQKYELLYKQILSIASDENDRIALMANVASMIHHTFGFLWTGFYRVDGRFLILGPFQGPLACMRIGFGSGVCGTAWKEGKTIVVPDVDKFHGHIACSSDSKSEIVVPLFENGSVTAVLDIDSAEKETFDHVDAFWLEKIATFMSDTLQQHS